MSAPTILIIDDDPDFVAVTTAILETKQYNVRFAYNPEDGLAEMEKQHWPNYMILGGIRLPRIKPRVLSMECQKLRKN